jgi:hypothetical protein
MSKLSESKHFITIGSKWSFHKIHTIGSNCQITRNESNCKIIANSLHPILSVFAKLTDHLVIVTSEKPRIIFENESGDFVVLCLSMLLFESIANAK